MRIKEKTNLILKTFAWIAIVINGLIAFLWFYLETKETNFIKFAIISALAISIYAFVRIQRDIAVDDLSLASIIIFWSGVLIFSSVLAYHLFFINIIGFTVLIVMVILEIATIFIITKRNCIYNHLKKIFKTKEKKPNRKDIK